ncbi:pectinesterase inhibitor 10-like [Gambusia affinis]|uniref:pectinesterase inhibitor 10-like n=1 Tax=Gambusia affinis TaxID=33528 RepID=UPI001CDB56B3|nr:pectinesterase inhibitor 10-like [Gambusia affinis]
MRSVGGPSSPVSSSSEEAPPPLFSITSRRLQDEFLKERLRRLESRSDASSPRSSSPSSSCSPGSPASPAASPLLSSSPQAPPPPSPSSPPRQPDASTGLSLSSPELLLELTRRQTYPLRRVQRRSGLTTIFSGRGRQVSGSSP